MVVSVVESQVIIHPPYSNLSSKRCVSVSILKAKLMSRQGSKIPFLLGGEKGGRQRGAGGGGGGVVFHSADGEWKFH